LRTTSQAIVYVDYILVGTSPSLILNDNTLSDPSSSLANTSSSVSPSILHSHYLAVLDVLNVFREHHLFVKGSKLHLFKSEIKFCGHILCQGTRRAAKSKLEAIRKCSPENIKTITHLKQFLGLAQYYAIYMPHFAQTALLLTLNLKGTIPETKKLVWN